MTSCSSLARAASAILLASAALGCAVDPSTCLKDQHVSPTTGTCVPDCSQGQHKANGLCVSDYPNAIVSIGPDSSSGSGGRTGFCPVIVPATLSVHIGQVIESPSRTRKGNWVGNARPATHPFGPNVLPMCSNELSPCDRNRPARQWLAALSGHSPRRWNGGRLVEQNGFAGLVRRVASRRENWPQRGFGSDPVLAAASLSSFR